MIKMLLIPVFAQICLTFGLTVALARSRVEALRRGDVAMKDIALGQQDAWPEKIRQIGQAYQNQFEAPILFFVLVALVIATGMVDIAQIVGAWLFVAARFAHAYIHTTSNRVPRRFQAFLAGFIVLGLMWIEFALRVLLS